MLKIRTVYKHPLDYPNNFVVREFEITHNQPPKPKDMLFIGNTIDEVRAFKDRKYPHDAILMRNKGDHISVIESWF